MTHIPALDGLRAIAVLMVLVTHFWPDPQGYTALNRLAAFGWAGVDLFFVLSGFLITRILWRSREQAGYFRRFYMRRTLRIFPLYYAVLGVILIGLPLVTTLPETVMADRWMYFAYLSNVALAVGGWQLFLVDITWSLAIEEQFYVVWPAVVRWATRRRLVALCVGLLVLCPLARLLLFDALGWRWLHMGTPFRLDAFAVGALTGLVAIPRMLSLGTFAAGSTMLAALVLTGGYARDTWIVSTLGYSLNALTAGAALVLAVNTRWLTLRPLRYLGTVSYGLYLLHPLCLAVTSVAIGRLTGREHDRLTGLVPLDALLGLLLPFAVTLAAAAVSYHVYEQPFLQLKRHYEPQRRQHRHEAPALA